MKTSNEYETQRDFNEYIQNDDYTLKSIGNEIHKEDKLRYVLKETLLWVRALLFVVIVVLIVRGFIGEPVRVVGPSMENTLIEGDVLIMSKISLEMKGIQRDDIIIIEIQPVTFDNLSFLNDIVWFRRLFPAHSREDYIKRVIAFENEEISLIDGIVYIDGKRHDEPYLKNLGSTFEKLIDMPYVVPKGHIFVMGDNRAISKDSRSIGPIAIESVIGKIVFRAWPINKIGPIN
jgi:signal peptidase I